jgi:hypothetical protein
MRPTVAEASGRGGGHFSFFGWASRRCVGGRLAEPFSASDRVGRSSACGSEAQ